jgi:hypothetical protein
MRRRAVHAVTPFSISRAQTRLEIMMQIQNDLDSGQSTTGIMVDTQA